MVGFVYEYDPGRTTILFGDPYGLRLENRYTVKRIEGSNPSLSAIFKHEMTPNRNIWGSFFGQFDVLTYFRSTETKLRRSH